MKMIIMQSFQWLVEHELVYIYGYVIMDNHIHVLWEQLKMNSKETPKGSFEIKFKCREALLDDDNILDEYIASNFDYLTTRQISILVGFKKKIKSSFVIFKCLTNYAIFIDTKDNKFYAVKALADTFDQFFDNFPVNISTTLIPFKDKIIYDGFIQSSGVYYGRNMTQTMNDDYKEAKRNKKIVTKIDE